MNCVTTDLSEIKLSSVNISLNIKLVTSKINTNYVIVYSFTCCLKHVLFTVFLGKQNFE